MRHTCSQCHAVTPHTAIMVKFADEWVCMQCKPLFVQRLKEGVEAEPYSVPGAYVFKPWVATYSLWLGILQLLGLNLAGLLWIYWWYKMKYAPYFKPKWLYWIHVTFVVVATVCCIVSLTPLRQSITITYWGYTITNPSLLLALGVALPIGIIYAIPLLGIKRNETANKEGLEGRQLPNQP